MKQSGRKSVSSIGVAPLAVYTRLQPVDGLTDAERREWLTVVNARPADWFGPEHATMLTHYVRHKTISDGLVTQIHNFDPARLADDEGIKRYDALLKMLDRETKQITSLLRSMRMTQQSLIRAEKRLNPTRSRKPWELDDKS